MKIRAMIHAFSKIQAVACLALALLPALVPAAPIPAGLAEIAVQNWISRGARPLDADLGQTVYGTLTYGDETDEPLFHVVYLAEGGFVVTSADTGIEPVIAFSREEDLAPAPENPLYSMLIQDMAVRKQALAAAQQQGGGRGLMAAAGATQAEGSPEAQWSDLLDDTPTRQMFSSVSSVSDVRVSPLVQTKWAQGSVGSDYCYNYYTPNHSACGCVATAMAQLMKFHEYPAGSVAARSFPCKVNNVSQTLTMQGGKYSWGSMPNVPASVSLSAAQRQALGKLCYDAGVSVEMAYTASSSGASAGNMCGALKSTFNYASAVLVGGYGTASGGTTVWDSMTENEISKCVLANIDNGYPVILSIQGNEGHVVLADGYGFNSGTRYVHLNMGWGGASDVWYTLPNIGTAGAYSYSYINGIVYNVFTDSEKKLVSGRVLNASGSPVAGASVEIRSSTGALLSTLTTNGKGMYAFARNGTAEETLKLRASSGGQSAERSVALFRSTTSRSGSSVGNLWGQDLVLGTTSGSHTITLEAIPPAGGSVAGGGTKTANSPCTVTATPNSGYAFVNWAEGATVISSSESYTFTVAGDRTLTANFTAGNITLATALDTTALAWTASGDASWYGQSSATQDGVDAARSGAIGHSQSSTLQTTVTGSGTLTFYWAVSSEANCDFLKFYLDGAEQSAISGATLSWVQKSYTISGSGPHTLQWMYVKDASTSNGSDAGFVDQVVWTPSIASYTVSTISSPAAGGTTAGGGSMTAGASCTVTASPESGYRFVHWKDDSGTVVSASASHTFTVSAAQTLTACFVPDTMTLQTALDNTSFTFTTSGSGAGWFGQTATKKNGASAAQSGPVGNSQSSIMQTTLTGSGTLTFWWKVSSESTYDYLKFYIDGVEQSGSISGTVDWQQKTFTLPDGSHTVQWAYVKDSIGSDGSDCGWVDQLGWTQTMTLYTISASASPAAGGSVSGAGSVPAGASCTLTATPNSGYAFVNWKEGSAVVGTSAAYTFTATGNRTLTANFVPMYTVTATAVPSVGGTVAGGGTMASGASCTLTATPDSGYAFVNWKEGSSAVSTLSTYTFTVTGNKTLTANFAASIPLATALDGAGLAWATSGDASWYGQTATKKSGASAAQNGAITHNQSSTLQTTVTGPGTFSFWWAVSSEANYDLLTFHVNDVEQASISGETISWAQRSVMLGSGTHTLKWVYAKDGSTSKGLDAGFVDKASWVPNTKTYTITTSSSPTAGGTTSGGGSKISGSTCTVTATPASGYAFSSWKAGSTVVSTSASYSFTVTANRALTAVFTAAVSLPDFTVESLTLTPPAATCGGTMTALIVVKNIGEVAGAVGWIDVWLDRATEPPIGSEGDAWVELGVLAPGETHTFSHAFIVPPGAGTKTYRVFVDSFNGSFESDESNNQRTATYTALTSIPLEIAVDNEGLAFMTGGDASWVGQIATSYDGVDAAQSGGIYDDETSTLQTTVTGPGTLRFWWKVSSEEDYDWLLFSIDGVVQDSISGEQGWEQKEISIPAGEHVLRWTYSKDEYGYAGFDCGWVDQIEWVPPAYTISASASPLAGGSVSGAGSKAHGATCTLTATPAADYTFVNWKEDGSVVATTPTYAFMVTGNRTLAANFSPVAQCPDFIVQSVSFEPSSVVPGGSVTATITVTNQGTVSGDGGYLASWIDRSSEASIGSDGDGWASVGILEAGESATFTHTFAAPAAVGNKTYRAFVDSADITLESDESNNQTAATYTVATGGGASSVTLADALDNTDLVWATNGDAAWIGQTVVTHDGMDAAQTGVISHNQESVLQTTVTGPGTIGFWWCVSSESNCDKLKFFIDGAEQPGSISGEVAWEQKSFTVGSGTHTLKWAYVKDGSLSSGSDCGWVDQLTWTPPLYIITTAASPAAGGATSGAGAIYGGTSCTVTASPNAGYTFLAWKEHGLTVSTSDAYTFTVTGDRTLTAAFRPERTSDPYITPFGLDDELATIGSYSGYIFDGVFDSPYFPEDLHGTLSVKVTKLTGTLTAKAVFMGGSVSFSAKSWDKTDADGTRRVTMTARTGEILTLAIRQDRMIGDISGGKAGDDLLIIDGVRVRFTDKKDDAAKAVLENIKGYYTAIIDPLNDGVGNFGELGCQAVGCGYLTITVKAGGSVKFSGKLADGTSVSSSSQLLWFEQDNKLCAPLFVPIYSKKGTLGGLVWIDRDTRKIETVVSWFKAGKDWAVDGFYAPVPVWGGWYNKKPEVLTSYTLESAQHSEAASYYSGGVLAELMCSLGSAPITMSSAGKMKLPPGKPPTRYGKGTLESPYGYDYNEEAVKPSLTFTLGTGIFKGSSKAYYDYDYGTGKLLHKTVSIPYAGVMVQVDDTLTVGAGHNLFTETLPALKTYKIKWGGLVYIY